MTPWVFDDHQPHQLAAIQAITDLFAGQPAKSLVATELGLANALLLDEASLLANTQGVQASQGLPVSEQLAGPHFAVEMETGTGKTYVYLRTIHELHARHGFAKFVIVVPSVAIREGVLKTLALTRSHFQARYGAAIDDWVYDASRLSRLRQFAESDHLQVMVLNIDAFNKQANVMHKAQDRLAGRMPVEFIQAARPIVVVDEPQNMESEAARAALEGLAPLLTLRYSATHRHSYNMVHRLDPVRAYDLGLVKRISVASVVEADAARGFLRLDGLSRRGATIAAKLTLDVAGPGGPVRETRRVLANDNLLSISGGRACYQGFTVEELHLGEQWVRFANGVMLRVGESLGEDTDAVMRAQLHETIREHLDKELEVAERLGPGRRMKVLSLVFIDRVANYAPEDGKVRRWFVASYQELAALPRYRSLALPPVEAVHAGYFAQSRGAAKDTTGATRADEEAYALIMRDKERLVSPDEPLRFIFSHSALREGWDNPNVFQICTLNETRSEIKKRQEIGRGLRLPVTDTGDRCTDPALNRLTVIANETYEAFCRQLQHEIREAFGTPIEGRIENGRERRVAALKPGWRDEGAFLALWAHLGRRTDYRVAFATDELVKRAAAALAALPPLTPPRLVTERADLALTGGRLSARRTAASTVATAVAAQPVPDLLGALQRDTDLSRATLAAILVASGRLEEVPLHPERFLDRAGRAIARVRDAMMVEGVSYAETGAVEDASRFESRRPAGDAQRLVPVEKGLYDVIEVANEAERRFVAALDARPDVRLVFSLPGWLAVPSPVGDMAGGFAVAFTDRLAVVDLAPVAPERERCLQAHFQALGLSYQVVTDAHAR